MAEPGISLPFLSRGLYARPCVLPPAFQLGFHRDEARDEASRPLCCPSTRPVMCSKVSPPLPSLNPCYDVYCLCKDAQAGTDWWMVHPDRKVWQSPPFLSVQGGNFFVLVHVAGCWQNSYACLPMRSSPLFASLVSVTVALGARTRGLHQISSPPASCGGPIGRFTVPASRHFTSFPFIYLDLQPGGGAWPVLCRSCTILKPEAAHKGPFLSMSPRPDMIARVSCLVWKGLC